MFTAVTWWGDESQIEVGNVRVTPNYYCNVRHAFATASSVAAQVSLLPGQKLIGAHSLGNMLVSSAIKDHGLNVGAFFLFDAAVAEESYDGTVMYRDLMRNPIWQEYSNRLWATEWHGLFDETDGRRQLTWRNRFGNIPVAYNYYSSGEEVLNNADGTLKTVFSSEWAWMNQEMRKGVMHPPSNSQAGWDFNDDYDVPVYTNMEGIVLMEVRPPDSANLLTEEEIRQNSFFSHFDVEALHGANGSVTAQNWQVRAEVLAEGIPALSRAMGRNALIGFGNGGLDMNDNRNGWPQSRQDGESTRDRWLHSDLKNIAYQFTYRVFDDVVHEGNLP
jgi:hypothetical protein